MRQPVSQALVDLREGLEMSQQRFAVEILNCAVGTVARYETFAPPKGEMLLRLMSIAAEAKMQPQARVFEEAWREEIDALWNSYQPRQKKKAS